MMAGQLRHRAWLLKRHASTDVVGGAQYAYVRSGSMHWCEVIPTGSVQVEIGEKLVTRTAYDVRMRYTVDVTSNDRLEFDGRQLEITAAIDVENRGREMLLTCVEAS